MVAVDHPRMAVGSRAEPTRLTRPKWSIMCGFALKGCSALTTMPPKMLSLINIDSLEDERKQVFEVEIEELVPEPPGEASSPRPPRDSGKLAPIVEGQSHEDNRPGGIVLVREASDGGFYGQSCAGKERGGR